MRRIPMLDLEACHAPLEPELLAAAARVVRSRSFILGQEVDAFEREAASALGVSHAVGVSSGSDALVTMLTASGVAAGDEVVTSPFSFFATAEAIVRVGARPVFADIERESFNLDPAQAIAQIGPRTKAVVVVHLFGRMARTDPLVDVCARTGIPLLEDAAQAIGARDGRTGGRAGSVGLGAALSFFPAKNLGGFGDGGMVLTNDGAFAARIGRLRVHGASERFHHETIGGNYRLDELQAALLRVKLSRLSAWTTARREIADAYRRNLSALPVVPPPPDDGCVWNQFVIRVPDGRRTDLARYLDARAISSTVLYPIPLHLQRALAGFDYRRGDFPVAERVAEEALGLPIFPGLEKSDIDRVAAAIADFFR